MTVTNAFVDDPALGVSFLLNQLRCAQQASQIFALVSVQSVFGHCVNLFELAYMRDREACRHKLKSADEHQPCGHVINSRVKVAFAIYSLLHFSKHT